MRNRPYAAPCLSSIPPCEGRAQLFGIRLRTLCRGLLAVAFLGSVGCTSIQVALGLKMRLDKVSVSAVTVRLFKGPGLAPGKSSRLVAVATTADGKQLVTEGAGHGKVLWDSFDLEPTIAQVIKKGVVTLPADPRTSEGGMPHLRIRVKGHPEISAEIDIPVRYDANFVANFSGADGATGSSGFDGTSGSDGADGSTDPKNPAPGGDGGDGSPGGDGGDGGPGEPGQHVHVWVRLKEGGQPLLQVRVASPGNERLYLVDPRGGTLLVKADGGRGGSGGPGGSGGAGGSGGSGSPSGSGGSRGADGAAGWSGGGGAAGTILVTMDPRAKPFLNVLLFSNKDGYGKPGPAPEIKEEPVSPLW